MSLPVSWTAKSEYGRIAVTTVGKKQTALTHVRTIQKSVACSSFPNQRRVIATQLTTVAFKDERLNQLNSWQEALYHRILIAVGDGDELVGDAQFIRGFLFPLKTTLRVTQVDSALNALVSANLIGLGVKPDNRPYLWIIRPEAADSLVQSKGGEGTSSRGYGNINKYKGTEGYERTKKANLGISEEFGITDEEVDKHREAWQSIEDEARRSGLSITQNSMEFAEKLVEDYGIDMVLMAIKESFDCPKWRYVSKVLQRAKEEGRNPGDPKKTSSKWYTGNNDDLTQDEWGGVLQVGDF